MKYKSLLNADIEQEEQRMEADYRSQEWMMSHPKLSFIIEMYWDRPKYYFISKTICRIIGHDLIDEGYGGPESGYIDISCKRCGWSSYHQLY